MSKNSKLYKMTCPISDYFAWDDIINENVIKFYESYSIYPNLMLASEKTWSDIDQIANLFNPEKLSPIDELDDTIDINAEIKSISVFRTENYALQFCLDEKVSDDYFTLIFEEDPIFDGEPYDSEDEEITIYTKIA